jgi:hypothetical protein
LVTVSHSILVRWRKYFSRLLNIHGVNDVRQREIHTAELLVPESSAFTKFGVAVKKLIRHKLSFINQNAAELM